MYTQLTAEQLYYLLVLPYSSTSIIILVRIMHRIHCDAAARENHPYQPKFVDCTTWIREAWLYSRTCLSYASNT